MKKTWVLTISLIISISSQAMEEAEQEFIARVKAVVKSNDFSRENLETIWMIGDTPPQVFNMSKDKIKALHSQGIKKPTFMEVFPAILDDMKKPIVVEGKTYTPNLEPYKMVEFQYSREIVNYEGEKSKSSLLGWSHVVGFHEGRLYMTGLKEETKQTQPSEKASQPEDA